MRSRTFAAVRVGVSLAIIAGLVYKLSPSELADTIRGSNLLLLLEIEGLGRPEGGEQ